MNAPDPFALGGYSSGGDLADEIIVDEEEKAALALVAREPVLGPLAHRLFKAAELYGNTVGIGAAYEERALAYRALDRAIPDTPAQTIGGIAWQLDRLCQTVDGCCYDLDDWTVNMLRRARDDALRLAQAELAGKRVSL
jgi:hypothetical protein